MSYSLVYVVLGIAILLSLVRIRIVKEYERLTFLRLGKFYKIKGPGLVVIIPLIDTVIRVDLRTVTLDIPAQEVITKDNIPVQINAVCYFRVVDPKLSSLSVQNYFNASSQFAQTSLRSVCGEIELDQILSDRDFVNHKVQQIVDSQSRNWGVEFSIVEIKDVQLPADLQKAFASQAQAERERKAKIIAAEGEFQAAEKLKQAADILERNPISLQLKYLQTMRDVSQNTSSSLIVPIPVELLSQFNKKNKE